jgi:hypothetical protein
MIARRLLFQLYALSLLHVSCRWAGHDGASLNNMVPKTVRSARSEGDLSVPGTRLKVHSSGGLKADSAGQTVYKDGLGSIKIIYSTGMQDNDSLKVFLYSLDSVLQKDKSRVYYSRNFQMDSCPAHLYYLSSAVPGQDQLVLSFGNEAFSVAASTLFPAGDQGVRDSLLHIMLSVYMDDQTPADVTAMQPFTLDVSHTEFLYSASLGQIFLYTIGGKPNPHFEADQDQFFVVQLPPRPGVSLRDRAVELLNRYAMAHVRILHYTVSRVFIRENEAYELEGSIQFDNKQGRLFMVIMGDPSHTLVLSASLYKNIDQRLAEVIRIVQSMEFKSTITN